MLRKVVSIVKPLKVQSNYHNAWLVNASKLIEYYSTTNTVSNELEKKPAEQKKNISKAMKAYLERAREHDEFMREQNHEFQISKRHLANMMGENPETFTQEDVNNAIEYLFPSGLYEKRARPMMLPPEEIFPQRKAAEFDETGRPYHFLFYTGKPNFYQLLHNTVQHIIDLNRFEDAMIRKGIKPDADQILNLSGYQWIDKVSLENKIVETLGDKDYDSFINALERLSSLPYAYKVKDFIMDFRKPLLTQTQTFNAPKPQYDADGRAFVTVYECLRKAARGHVTIKSPGTGKITINEQDITYFHELQNREQVSAFKIYISYITTV